MWCFQKPGYEALLLAELQRQQQCSQFCDTLLRTEGVSVPAHSCILSAISPHISSALSSTPPPPAGQSRLLDFKALGTCTLLHMVRLFYSGEMAGEGEVEKQDAISAAAKLGIHGLVEVTRGDRRRRHEDGDGWRAEVGVQTEPEETDGRRGRWRREVRDGSTFLWKETLSEGEKDTWTQTEEVQVNTAPAPPPPSPPPPPPSPPPPPHPAVTFETINMAALQSLGETDSHLLPPEIPYVPISLVYPADENTHHPSSGFVDSTAAGHTSVAVLAPPHTSTPPPLHPYSTPCAADPQNWWSTPQRDIMAAEECENEQLEQFQGNIPGYINYFLNPAKEESPCRGRPRGRRAAAGRGARRAGTGERRARRPRAGTGGRGRGGLTQTVDVQEVGVSRLQKLFLQRWSMRTSRTGQGGGAAGRKLYLKTRELLKPPRQRRRGRSKGWEFSPSRDMLRSEAGAGNAQRGRRNTMQQFNQDGLPVGRAQRARAQPTVSVTFSSPPVRFYNLHTLSASSPSLLSPAASYVSPASSLLHSTPVPPLAPPPLVEQPEHIDRLLEEVMMGLDILPNTNNGAPCSQPPPTRSSSCASSGITLAPNKQVETTGVGNSSSEEPVLQQQREGELTEMLEHFLQSFEQHIDSCTVREEAEMGVQSCTETPVRSSQITEQCQNNTCSQPRKAPVCSAVAPKCTEGTPGKNAKSTKRRKKRRKNEYLFSLEKKRVRVKARNPAPSSDAKTKTNLDQGDKQLQQMPVVKLERRGPLPARVTLQGHSSQSLDIKGLEKTKSSSSSERRPHDHLSGNNQLHPYGTKIYPIRSRFTEAQMNSLLFLEEPLARPPGRKRGRPRKNGHPRSSTSDDTSTPPIQPEPVDEQLEKNQEHVQPQEEAVGPMRRGKKRGAESEEETSDDGTVNKRVCVEQTPPPTAETCTPSSESASIETEDIIDVETVSLTSVGDCLQREGREEKPLWSQLQLDYLRETEMCLTDEEMETSSDEIIDVDGDEEDDHQKKQSRAATAPSYFADVKPSVSRPSHSDVNLGSTGSWDTDKDEDIDVTGGSSPALDPVIIRWTESSEGEKEEGDEDVDVVEEEKTQVASVVFAI